MVIKMQRLMKNFIKVRGMLIILAGLMAIMCMRVNVHAQENTTYQI